MKRKYALMVLGLTWTYALLTLLFKPEGDWYSYHMSFNEHWYSRVLRGETIDQVLPPGYVFSGWIIKTIIPFNLLSDVVALRLISILSFGLLFLAIYKYYNSKTAIFLASMPYVVVWSSRAQTDMMAYSLAFIGLILVTNDKNKYLSGIITGLSTIIKPTGILISSGYWNIKYWTGVIIGSTPFIIWLIMNPKSINFHETSSVAFGDSIRLLWSLVVGIGMGWAILNNKIKWNQVILLIVLTLFMFYKAPIGHEYYLLPVYIAFLPMINTDSKKYWFYVMVNALMGLGLLILLNNYMP